MYSNVKQLVLRGIYFSIFPFAAFAIVGSMVDDANKLSSIDYSVEDVRIVKEYSNAWAVKGKIINNSNRSVKGGCEDQIH